MMDHITNAQVLIEALPYIQKYCGKTIVVKYGGNAMINQELKHAVMRDMVLLAQVGIRVVLVHGGGPEINDMLARLGKESRFVGGLRYTDEETVQVAGMVLAGKVNKQLVSLIHENGGKAIGLCGIDGRMILARKHQGPEDLGFVGDITQVDPAPIQMALDNGYLPVIATIGSDPEGNLYNINADTAAAAIAAAMKAEKLISLTDTRGLLLDVADESTLIEKISIQEIPSLIQEGVISGGMIPKIQCCVDGIRDGLTEAVILDGRIQHSILIELFSDQGIGTLLYSDNRHTSNSKGDHQ